MTTLVMKFGGSTVGTIPGLTQVLSIVLYERERWDRLIVVVSALDGVTDMLLEAGSLAQMGNRRGYRRLVATLRTRHVSLLENLPLGAAEKSALQTDIDRLWFDLLDICQALSGESSQPPPPGALDAVVGTGERLAARIAAALLRQNQVRGVAIDATDLVITDDVSGSAEPNLARTRQRIAGQLLPMLDRKIVPVITGFIGATPEGKPTTLGRGGSDYSASIIALCVEADELWVWTDVDGMMSVDPSEIASARVIPFLSYEEVAEMSYFGARILHPRMIAPLRQRNIPLRVRNVFKPQQPGTLVQAGAIGAKAFLKAVTSIQGLGFHAPARGSLAGLATFMDTTLVQLRYPPAEVMIAEQAAEYSFVCYVIPTSAGPDASHNLQLELSDRLKHRDDLRAWSVTLVSVVTVIGDRIGESTLHSAAALQALTSVRVLAVAHGAARCSISVVIDPEDADLALNHLHALILKR
jgi:aspartate kinase